VAKPWEQVDTGQQPLKLLYRTGGRAEASDKQLDFLKEINHGMIGTSFGAFKSKRRSALEQKHRVSRSSKSRNGDAEVKCRKSDNVAGAERKENSAGGPSLAGISKLAYPRIRKSHSAFPS